MHENKNPARPWRKVQVYMLTAGLVALTGLWCGCESKTEKKARLEAEARALKQAQETQAKVDKLIKEAQTAQSQENFEAAESNIMAAVQIAPTNEFVRRLKAGIHKAAGAAKTTPLKDDVEAKLDQMKTLDRGQGFGTLIDALAPAVEAAKAEFDATKFDDVFPKYEDLVGECDRILALEALRAEALKQCNETETARKAAQDAAAPDDAQLLWSAAQTIAEDAAAMFERAEFPDAASKWALAAVEFGKAQAWALGEQSVRQAKARYDESLLANKDAPLEQFGGDDWARTKSVVEQAQLLTKQGDWPKAVEAWAASCEWLDVAVKSSKLAAEEDRKRREHLKALANFNTALDKAGQNLGRAKEMPKTDPEGMKLLEEGLAALDATEQADWYKLLTAAEQIPLPVMRAALKLERFHFRYPDLEAVTNAAPAETLVLAPGYVAAVARQTECSAERELPVEVRSRKTGIRFRLVPPGTYTMGSDSTDVNAQRDEAPHEVTIAEPFYMGVLEISQAEWKKLGLKNPSFFTGEDDNLPVETVSWTDAESFCKRLARLEGARIDGYRLPSEDEWEYACRAGSTAPYYTGNVKMISRETFWCEMNSGKATHPGGKMPSNAWGLRDMAGNVWEWCLNAPYVYSKGEASAGGTKDSPHKAMRGGSWNETPDSARSANRGSAHYSEVKSYDVGLRVMRVL